MKPASKHPAVTGNRALTSRMAKNPADKKPSPGGRGSYDLDDEVFFQGADGPRSGRVVSHGQHGCTVDEPCGKRHQVLWDGVLGLNPRCLEHVVYLTRAQIGKRVAALTGYAQNPVRRERIALSKRATVSPLTPIRCTTSATATV